MSSGAGERPRTSNGACGVASQRPHVASPQKPKLSRMIAIGREDRAGPVDREARLRRHLLEAEAEQQVDGGEGDHERERPAPADRGREPAGEEEGEHARRGDGRGEESDRPAPAGAVVVRGDEDRERRRDERDDGTRRRLRDEQHRRAHAERDAEHRERRGSRRRSGTPRGVPKREPIFAPSRMNAAMANVPAVIAVPTEVAGVSRSVVMPAIETVSALTANDAWIWVSTTTMSGSHDALSRLGAPVAGRRRTARVGRTRRSAHACPPVARRCTRIGRSHCIAERRPRNGAKRRGRGSSRCGSATSLSEWIPWRPRSSSSRSPSWRSCRIACRSASSRSASRWRSGSRASSTSGRRSPASATRR